MQTNAYIDFTEIEVCNSSQTITTLWKHFHNFDNSLVNTWWMITINAAAYNSFQSNSKIFLIFLFINP